MSRLALKVERRLNSLCCKPVDRLRHPLPLKRVSSHGLVHVGRVKLVPMFEIVTVSLFASRLLYYRSFGTDSNNHHRLPATAAQIERRIIANPPPSANGTPVRTSVSQ